MSILAAIIISGLLCCSVIYMPWWVTGIFLIGLFAITFPRKITFYEESAEAVNELEEDLKNNDSSADSPVRAAQRKFKKQCEKGNGSDWDE